MNIKHRPIFDIEKVEKLYSEKDGVEIRYMCTSATSVNSAYASDIFYRDTPHPEFGNRYFGLYWNANNQIMISGCDNVEKLDFDMVEVEGELHYSQHRHDFHSIGDVSIDGGRAYLRRMGNLSLPINRLTLKDGQFVENLREDIN